MEFRPIFVKADRIPTGLDIATASFWDSADEVTNIFVGNFGDLDIATFCHIHHNGDFSYEQTLMAIKSDVLIAPLSTLWQASEIRAERVGGWILLFRLKELVKPSEFLGFLSACMGLVRYFKDQKKSTPTV